MTSDSERPARRRYLPAVLSALVVAVLAAAYAAFFFLVVEGAEMVIAVKVFVSVIAILVIGGVAWALISRIRELQGGQEDDIGKY